MLSGYYSCVPTFWSGETERCVQESCHEVQCSQLSVFPPLLLRECSPGTDDVTELVWEPSTRRLLHWNNCWLQWISVRPINVVLCVPWVIGQSTDTKHITIAEKNWLWFQMGRLELWKSTNFFCKLFYSSSDFQEALVTFRDSFGGHGFLESPLQTLWLDTAPSLKVAHHRLWKRWPKSLNFGWNQIFAEFVFRDKVIYSKSQK